jgi:virginiamycin A acetyltransferase
VIARSTPAKTGKAKPPSLQRVQIRGREHPGVGDHDHVGDPVPLLERANLTCPRPPTRLRIGKYTSIASCDVFLGGNHHSEWVTQYPSSISAGLAGSRHRLVHERRRRDRSPLWLAHGCQIMSGVTIGHGAVVASKAVVTQDVEPYTIVGGVPAKVIRPRFDAASVDRLLSLAWWDWPEDRIRAELPTLLAPPT